MISAFSMTRDGPFSIRLSSSRSLIQNEPNDWVTEFGEDRERYSYPPSLNKAGFFEDFFDEKRKAVVTFWRVVNQRLAGSQRRVA